MIIAITGPMHVGKTALAEGLIKAFPFSHRVPMAQAVRDTADDLGLEHNRKNLQALGHGMRALDEDVWINRWKLAHMPLEAGHQYFIDDARYQNEIDLGTYVIQLQVGRVEQWRRYCTSDKFDDNKTKAAWAVEALHATEDQQLTFHGDNTLFVRTDNLSIEQVRNNVALWLSPRIGLPYGTV